MKIIKQGKQRKIIEYTGVCKYCECEFEVDDKNDQLHIDANNNRWVYCPNVMCELGVANHVFLNIKYSTK